MESDPILRQNMASFRRSLPDIVPKCGRFRSKKGGVTRKGAALTCNSKTGRQLAEIPVYGYNAITQILYSTFSFSMLSCNREDGRKNERGMRNSWKANSQPK